MLTKKVINEAGEILAKRKPGSIDGAFGSLNSFRAAHAEPLITFRNQLSRKLTGLEMKGLVSQRLKRAQSVIAKLENQKTMNLSQMQDIGGVRVVVDSLEDVYKLKNEFLKTEEHKNSSWEMIRETDYIVNPRKTGYRSIHLICRHQKKILADQDGCKIEIQLRTKIQHAWATSVEILGTYLGQALKQSFGDEKYLEAFQVISQVLEHFEKGNIIEYPLLVEEMNNLIEEIRLVEMLKGFAIATDNISPDKRKKGGEYFIVTLDSKNKNVSLIKYKKIEEANERYSELENSYLEDESTNIVLVSVENVTKLKELYPNYFLDSTEFLSYIVDIQKKVLE
jgi:ppGpp synthetase/RelA/SpoT-type nucleotidyltranferase